MNNKKQIHNIVAAAVLAEPMRQIRNEFMVLVRGYLRPKEKDTQLFADAEKAARKAMEEVLLERSGKKSDIITDALQNLRGEAKKEIMRLLKEHNIETINVQPYFQENYIDNWSFFDCDKNGNGECLECDAIKVVGDDLELAMYTNYGDYFCTTKPGNLTVSELLYLLRIVEDIIALHIEDGMPILKEDEIFEEYENNPK